MLNLVVRVFISLLLKSIALFRMFNPIGSQDTIYWKDFNNLAGWTKLKLSVKLNFKFVNWKFWKQWLKKLFTKYKKNNVLLNLK